MLAAKGIRHDNQMPYALNVCQVSGYNQAEHKNQNENPDQYLAQIIGQSRMMMIPYFSLSEKKGCFFFFFFHSMGGKLHNGIACIKDIAYFFFLSSYLVWNRDDFVHSIDLQFVKHLHIYVTV